MTERRTVQLGLFSPSVISAVAHRRGAYTARRLQVHEHPVSSSPQQFTSLRAGGYDLVLTAPDNVATYRFNHGNPLGEQLDVRIVAGVDAGLGLSLMARESIDSVTQLRGCTVAVDVPTSGFALVLYAMLEQHGLRVDRDLELVSAGSTPRRWAALADGAFDATLLNAGFDLVAEAAGYRRLSRVGDVAAPYLGTVLAATGQTLDERPDLVRSFLGAWSEARSHVLEPANAPEVTEVVTSLFGVPATAARTLYEVQADPDTGLVPDGTVPREALAAVLDLRLRQGGFRPGYELHELLGDESGLVDRRFAARA